MEYNQSSQNCGALCIRILLDELFDPLHAIEALYLHNKDSWTIYDVSNAIGGKGYHIRNFLALNDPNVFPCIIRVSKPDSHYLIVRRRFMTFYLIDNPSNQQSEWITKDRLQKFAPEQIITYERQAKNKQNTVIIIAFSLIDLAFASSFALNIIHFIVPMIYFAIRIVSEMIGKSHRSEQFFTVFEEIMPNQNGHINSLLFNDLFHVKIARLYEYEKSVARITYSMGSLLIIFLFSVEIFLVTLGSFVFLLLCTAIKDNLLPNQQLYQQFLEHMGATSDKADHHWKVYVRSSYFVSLIKQIITFLPNLVFIVLILLVESGQLTDWYDIIYFPRIPFYGILFWTWQNLSFLSNSIIHPGRFHRF